MVQGKSPFEYITNKIKKLQVIVDPKEHIQLPTVNAVNKPAIPLIKVQMCYKISSVLSCCVCVCACALLDLFNQCIIHY